jgi:hypothetical protein
MRTLTARLSIPMFAALSTVMLGGGPVSWDFDVTTSGQDVLWTSPTTVPTDAPRYQSAYTITVIEADVSWLIFDFTIDVTGDIPPELLSAESTVDGPLPLTVIEQSILYPEPPEPVSVQATIVAELDGGGFGQLSVTDVVLGTGTFELPGLGTQTANINSIRVAGTLDVTPLGPASDLNGDMVVDVQDLLVLLSAWGPCPRPCPPSCAADLDGDCSVSTTDLLALLADWGS